MMEARLALDKGIAIDADVPILYCMKGLILEQLKKYGEAEAQYEMCQEKKIGNLGSPVSHNEIIKKIGTAFHVEVYDAKKKFDEYNHDRGKFFNEGLVDDDCHPSIEGHTLIAKDLAKIILDGNGKINVP